MIEEIKKQVRELLTSGTIKGFLGLREIDGHIAPYLFCDAEDMDSMNLGDYKKPGDARYPLNRILIHLLSHYPDEILGVLVRGCDQRGLNGLYSLNQLDPEKVIPVGIPCPPELAEACECSRPYPENRAVDGQAEGYSNQTLARIAGLDIGKRFEYWMNEFARCIKCYGCRDICPMCICRECSLECGDLVGKGDIPPENPIFHLIRAVHMADRCVDCGLCAEACPADIPLRTLYKKVADIVKKEFDFQAGYQPDAKSPLNVLDQ